MCRSPVEGDACALSRFVTVTHHGERIHAADTTRHIGFCISRIERRRTAAVSPIEDALTTRLLQSTIHALELYSIYLGKELGLYAALQSGDWVTPPELARHAGIAPRYAREWLEQQAVAGFLEVDVPLAPADARRYRLPAAHVNVLVTEDHPAHLAPLAR